MFYVISSFAHHFLAISKFKLELQYGNVQFGSKSATAIFCPMWPWNLAHDLKNYRVPPLCYFNLCASFCTHMWIQAGVTVRWLFWPCDLEIWQMILKNKRASLFCYSKLFVSFHSNWWNKTRVTVQKRLIRVKIGDSLSCVAMQFDGWLWKAIGHYATA